MSSPKIDLTFSILYLIFVGGAIITELIGVASKRKGDTISENWWWADAHLHGPAQWSFHVFTLGVLIWTALHFWFHKG